MGLPSSHFIQNRNLKPWNEFMHIQNNLNGSEMRFLKSENMEWKSDSFKMNDMSIELSLEFQITESGKQLGFR